MQINIKSFLFLFLLTFSFTTSAEVHKWKDANGKTHYGDAPFMAGLKELKPISKQMTRLPTVKESVGKRETAAKVQPVNQNARSC